MGHRKCVGMLMLSGNAGLGLGGHVCVCARCCNCVHASRCRNSRGLVCIATVCRLVGAAIRAGLCVLVGAAIRAGLCVLQLRADLWVLQLCAGLCVATVCAGLGRRDWALAWALVW